MKYDAATNTVDMRGPVDLNRFSWKVDDPNHLTLTIINAGANSKPKILGTARAQDMLGAKPVVPVVPETV